MSSRFITPFADFGAGITPSDGALLYFSENNLPFSTNPKDTDTDNTGAIQNANPVVADAEGVFSDIYLNGSYRAVLTDKNGVQIWQADNIKDLATANRDVSPITFATTAAMAGASTIEVDDVVSTKEFATGTGGPGTYDVVLTSGVTPNAANVITGVNDATLSFVLRQENGGYNLNAMGLVTGSDGATVVQAAHDALPNGGRMFAEPASSPYQISLVTIANVNITADFSAADLIRSGSGGASERGMFTVSNLLDARFELIFKEADLNGEGCREIGTAGKLANTYATQTAPPIKALSGPLNSLVYTLRASGIKITGDCLRNTAEVALLFRNSAGIRVDIRTIENCGNGAVEFNFPEPAADGGTGTVPDFENYDVDVGQIRHVNDFGLGSGNGTGIGFLGGAASNPPISGVKVNVGEFLYVLRDFHVEFNGGGYLTGAIVNYTSRYCQQGSLGVIAFRDSTVNATIFRPCGPGAAALNSGFPTIYGATFSADCVDTKVNLLINDSRDEIILTGTDGAITSGDKTFTSAAASFAAGDVGKMLSYKDGSDTDCVFESKIASINSTTSVELELNAPLTVSSKDFAYGGTCRFGVRMSTIDSIDLMNSKVVAGKNSGLGSEPEAAGILIEAISNEVRLMDVRVKAPALTAGTAPRGVSIPSSTMTGKVLHSNLNVSGFTDDYDNFNNNVTDQGSGNFTVIVGDTASKAIPSATANTYGTENTISPERSKINLLSGFSLESSNVSAETLTTLITFNFPNGATNTLEVAFATDTTTALTAAQLSNLHKNNSPIISISMQSKSTKSSSTAFTRAAIIGYQD